MNATDTVTILILILGVATVALSLYASYTFAQHTTGVGSGKSRLSHALMWQLYGEAVIGAGTVIFSLASHYGVLSSWPLDLQSMLRLVMFTATAVTTVHLVKTIKSL